MTYDIEIYDLENFRYNFVNLTAFRLVDTENPSVRQILRDMEKFQPKGQPILNRTNVIRVCVILYINYNNILKYELININ